MSFYYQFPAVKGIQANREYYITMVPLKLLNKLFPDETDIVLPEYRAQRRVNEARIPEIKKYILDNRDTYVFSALSASIDGDFSFEQAPGIQDAGLLKVDMDAVFLINDGQHRKAAINEAMNEDPSLGNETISIVFFQDKGLAHSQQMFTDLNKHAVKTSNSLSTLYDSRDQIAVATKEIIENNVFFNKYTDKERDILGKNSSKLFTLTNIYKANIRILRSKECSEDDIEFLKEYWNNVTSNIIEWNDLLNQAITKKDLRENYIITLAVTITALGKLGRFFYDNRTYDMIGALKKLQNIDWMRSCSENWLNRTIKSNGKVMNNELAITLTCSKIKSLIGVKLNNDELIKEAQLTGE